MIKTGWVQKGRLSHGGEVAAGVLAVTARVNRERKDGTVKSRIGKLRSAFTTWASYAMRSSVGSGPNRVERQWSPILFPNSVTAAAVTCHRPTPKRSAVGFPSERRGDVTGARPDPDRPSNRYRQTERSSLLVKVTIGERLDSNGALFFSYNDDLTRLESSFGRCVPRVQGGPLWSGRSGEQSLSVRLVAGTKIDRGSSHRMPSFPRLSPDFRYGISSTVPSGATRLCRFAVALFEFDRKFRDGRGAR